MRADAAPLALGAVLCGGGCAALGAAVARRTPTRLDVEAAALRGVGTPAALVFTALGRGWAVGLVAAAAAAVAARTGGTRGVAALFGSQALSQVAVALLKRHYDRARPDYWLVIRERQLSYPSGHAVTAAAFYAPLAVFVAREPALDRGVARALATALGICVAGIPWSRLALGAHYATDVAGGLLFGAAWTCATFAFAAALA